MMSPEQNCSIPIIGDISGRAQTTSPAITVGLEYRQPPTYFCPKGVLRHDHGGRHQSDFSPFDNHI
uniref:Uncharacterized protein n=1 Tax=Romanomermis culicivorax TaxID=13658 RepID=A0A915JLG8_ROMCU